MNPLDGSPNPPQNSTRLWIGVAVIVFGILAVLDNMPFHHGGFSFLDLWPVALVIIGIGKITQRSERGISGWLLVLGGIFLLVHNLAGDGLSPALGPLFIVAFGVFLVTRALRHNRGVPPELAADDAFVSSTAIFGGSKRRIAQRLFKGGELTAIFGGFDLDLRQALVEGNQVRLDVFVLFGGGELHVPQDWSVAMRGSAIMGAFEDKTLHMPAPEAGGPRVNLVVTGMVLFGGLTVTN